MYELIENFGWVRLVSKNPYMVSFSKDREFRMNIYFTTGTITIQDKDQNMTTYKDVHSLEEIEKICMV